MPPRDWGLALALAGLAVTTRIPFRAQLLPTWDAVQFALALDEYDIVKHQPHPPGYILYVALGRAVAAFVADPAVSLTGLAILASALTVLFVYRLAWALYDRATAVVASIGLLASPLFWFYGLVGLSYAIESALSVGIAGLAWALRRGEPRILVGSALALALAGGVRQSILFLLLPVWTAMAWAAYRRWPPVLAGGALIALASAVWFVPMVHLTGGLGRYIDACLELFDSTVRATTFGTGQWGLNVERLAEAFLLGVGLLLPVLAAGVGTRLGLGMLSGPRTRFFAAWVLPALLVYAFVHLGQYGYILTVLPACHILAARGLLQVARRMVPTDGAPWRRAALVGTALLAVVLVHTTFFLHAGGADVRFPPSTASRLERWTAERQAAYAFRLWVHTVPGLRSVEAVIRTYAEAVRREFDPADTVLVTEVGNPRSYPWFRHARYYLPEFTVYHLRLGGLSPGYITSSQPGGMVALGDLDILLPGHVRRLVWIVDHWHPALPRPPELEARPLAHGRWLYVLPVDRRPVEHAGYRLTRVAALARLR